MKHTHFFPQRSSDFVTIRINKADLFRAVIVLFLAFGSYCFYMLATRPSLQDSDLENIDAMIHQHQPQPQEVQADHAAQIDPAALREYQLEVNMEGVEIWDGYRFVGFSKWDNCTLERIITKDNQ